MNANKARPGLTYAISIKKNRLFSILLILLTFVVWLLSEYARVDVYVAKAKTEIHHSEYQIFNEKEILGSALGVICTKLEVQLLIGSNCKAIVRFYNQDTEVMSFEIWGGAVLDVEVAAKNLLSAINEKRKLDQLEYKVYESIIEEYEESMQKLMNIDGDLSANDRLNMLYFEAVLKKMKKLKSEIKYSDGPIIEFRSKRDGCIRRLLMFAEVAFLIYLAKQLKIVKNNR